MKFAKCNNINQNMALSNGVENKSKSKKNFKEEISLNLSLNGSQINLANRVSTSRDITPLSTNRALFLPSSCTFMKDRRPMSAVPELHTYKTKDENRFFKVNNSLRPQSADNISSAKQKRTGSLEFFDCGPQSKLNSTKLLNKLIKEPVMRSWQLTVTSQDTSRTSLSDSTIDEEVIDNSDTTETNEEEDECIQSEISFGTKIQNLAQRNSSMNLEPGIKHKPPLPQNKQRSLSPKKSDLSPPPGVSMSKEYQERYHSKPTSNEWSNFVTNEIEEEKSSEKIDFSTQKELCDYVGTPSIESKIDMYFQLSGNDTKIKEIEIFEQETDYLFKKLRSHQQAFTEYYEISKKLPEIIENEVVASANLDGNNQNISSHCEPNEIGDLKNNSAVFNNNQPSEMFIDEINDLIKKDFIQMNQQQQKADELQSDNLAKKTSQEKLKFSLDMYDKGLQKDKEFLFNSSSKFDNKKDSETKDNFDSITFETSKNDQKISNLLEQPDLSEMPEREFSSKKKKVETVQNMLSTLPSTYNDISSILQILENDNNSHNNNNINGNFNELQADCENKTWISGNHEHNSDQPNTVLNTPIKELSNNLKISPSKNYNEILTFLDEVDKSCSVILNAAKIRAYSVKKSTEKLINGTLPNMETLLQMNRVDLAQTLIGLYLELEEKTSSVQLLQETLNEQRQSTNKMLKCWESESFKKLKSQKTEYETAIKRHQTFIDQLINEKKSLTEQCENLIKQLKQQDERHASATKAAEHRFNVELQATKERQVIAEKLRREKWLLGKTEKIKEMTVKGLEPELHNMKARHEQEISDIRALHKQEIEELELRASRRTHQQCETLREQLKSEYDEVLQKEREALNQRVQKTIETEEKNYQEERRRLVSEHERLKQHLQGEYAGKSREFDTRLETAIKEKERAFEAIKSGYEDHIDTMIRKHKNEIKTLKENYDIEQESWKTNIRKEQEQWKLTKEKEIMTMCKKERDHEIELVIERLENESIELKKQIETTAENRIKRLNEKYLNEIKYLEESEKQAQMRYLDAKNQLVNNENDLIYLRGVIKKMENKIQELEEENAHLLKERGHVQEIIRKELESEMKSLQTQLINLRSEREREMEEVYERVKSVITKKDGTIAKMKQEYTLLEEKCEHLDQLLKNQRKTYLLEAN